MNRRMLPREDEATTEVTVTREDQGRINKFSTLHQKQGLLKEELVKKSVLIPPSFPPGLPSPTDVGKQQEKEAIDDVSTELELADEEEHILYKIGDSFIHLPLEDVQALLEASKGDVDKEVKEIEETMERNESAMGELKVELYKKFGKAINLEVG